jgi:cellulose synthase/poly-beta-1,6-N-acetylglucosamine synthase-like glycosyltransferase/putative flippase GtrA
MNEILLTIVAPTYNEEKNVRPFLGEVRRALGSSYSYEVLFVDDSDDNTPAIIREEMEKDARLRLVHRPKEERTGLATAFVKGFRNAVGKYICCLDSDLQHPPGKIPELLETIMREDADIVVASRHVPGGSGTAGLDNIYRKAISLGSKYLSYLVLTKTRVSTDPGSGFFLFKRNIVDGVELSPRGFKTLTEILMRAKYQKVVEVPYVLRSRERGMSKATLRQGIEFLKHIWILFITIPSAGRFIKFSMVGASGVLVNLGTLFVLVEFVGLGKITAWGIALLLAILNNFFLNSVFTYRDRRTSSWKEILGRMARYYAGTLATAAINFLVFRTGMKLQLHYMLAAFAGMATATMLNFALSSFVVWSSGGSRRGVLSFFAKIFPTYLLARAYKGKKKIRLKNNIFALPQTLRRVLAKRINGLAAALGFFTLSLYVIFILVIAGVVSFSTVLITVLILFSVLVMAQGLFSFFLMLYAWEDPERAESAKSPEHYAVPLLSFTALIPARHEVRVIGSTLRAIADIDYPEEMKEVIVICRVDDTETIAAAERAIEAIGKSNIRLVVFDGYPINKPHGLNIGLARATKDVVTVFDAEDEPHRDIYHVINTVMLRDNADVVQSGVQLMNYRSRWFSMFNVLEYFFWFKSALHFFARVGFIPLGGNTVFFKRSWLTAVGGWDDYCLTEDADIGVRLSVAGARIRVVYDEAHVTKEETPPTLSSFIRQRTRWNQGFLQIVKKNTWLKVPKLSQKLLAVYVLVWAVMQAVLFLYLPFSVWMILAVKLPVSVALVANLPLYIVLLHFITYNVGLYEFTKQYKLCYPLWLPLKALLFFYPFQAVLGLSAFRAVSRMLRGDGSWEKTPHTNAHREVAYTPRGLKNKGLKKAAQAA